MIVISTSLLKLAARSLLTVSYLPDQSKWVIVVQICFTWLKLIKLNKLVYLAFSGNLSKVFQTGWRWLNVVKPVPSWSKWSQCAGKRSNLVEKFVACYNKSHLVKIGANRLKLIATKWFTLTKLVKIGRFCSNLPVGYCWLKLDLTEKTLF